MDNLIITGRLYVTGTSANFWIITCIKNTNMQDWCATLRFSGGWVVFMKKHVILVIVHASVRPEVEVVY